MNLRIAVLILLSAALGSAQDTMPRPVQVDDFFKLKSVGSPQISPNGKWIAYTLSEKNLEKDKSETRIWMMSVGGGEPIPMTGKGYSAGSPRWSPDGKWLTFTAAKGGDDAKSQVWKLDLRGGESQQMTKVKQGVSGYEWSPDGKRLLLLIKDAKPEEDADGKEKKDKKKPKPHVIDRLQFKRDYVGYLDRRRTHLYVFTPGEKEPVQITSGDYDDSNPKWSPDGLSIAFVSNRSERPDGNFNSDIFIVAANNVDKGRTLKRLTAANTMEDYSPAWSPDGKHIAYVTVTAEEKVMWYATNHLAIIPVSGGEPIVLNEKLDRNVRNPKFSSDGKTIWFQLEDSGENQIASIKTDGSDFTRVVKGDLSARGFELHRDAEKGDWFVSLLGTTKHPEELFLHRVTDGEEKRTQLTNANTKLLKGWKLSGVENVQFKSKDGTEVEGFVYRPPGFSPAIKYPTILRIHGGPVAQYSHSFRFDPQFYAANGYVVIETNPRGSSGYGQEFSMALYADWGNKDYEDVNAGVDYLIERGIADPNKLGVGGWSYGGILTNYVITKTERFKGAVSGASEANHRANYGHDIYHRHWEAEFGLPWENMEAWERINPFNNVGKITTPTLWIGGAVDWNVPIMNSEQMYQAMKRLGRETQLVVYPGEHHGIRRLSFQKDRMQRFLGWYDKYVKGELKKVE